MNHFKYPGAAALLVCLPLPAQWLHYPTPGIPRTPDGKPNLTAPAPKTADGNLTSQVSGLPQKANACRILR
jgi:hypothetical protein